MLRDVLAIPNKCFHLELPAATAAAAGVRSNP